MMWILSHAISVDLLYDPLRHLRGRQEPAVRFVHCHAILPEGVTGWICRSVWGARGNPCRPDKCQVNIMHPCHNHNAHQLNFTLQEEFTSKPMDKVYFYEMKLKCMMNIASF